jgi:O-antigen/teichoic acid export membrane protein
MEFARTFAGSWSAAILGGRFRGYLEILAVGSGVRVFSLASQFVVLIILSRILSKDSFGDMMTAFGFYRLGAIGLGVGPSLVLLFHISRRPDDRDAEIRLHRYSAILAAAAAALVALIGVLAAEPIARAFGKPGLALWFVQLAPFAIFSTLLTVSTGALEGRSRVSESIMMGEGAPNAVRILLLPLVALASLPDSYVAHVLTLSVLAPWLWSARRAWDRSVAGLQPWKPWDYSYCGKFVVATLFANQLGAVDILVAGALFSSEAVADYAVASRIAALFSFFALALLKRFAPRAGQLIAAGDRTALRRETDLCRKLTIGCGALTIGGLVVSAPFLLPLFGDYRGAEVLLIWLAIPAFIQSFYATSDRLLIIAGQANVALVLTGSSFLVLTTTPFVTAPWLGMAAIPAAMIFSALAFNPVVAARVWRMFAFATIRPLDIALMGCGCAALAAHAVVRSSFTAVGLCVVLGAIGLYLIVSAVRPGRSLESA